MIFTGLGRKLLSLFETVANFLWQHFFDQVYQEGSGAAQYLWDAIGEHALENIPSYDSIIRDIRDNPEAAIGVIIGAALIPSPFAPLAIAGLAASAFQEGLSLSLADVRTETEVQASLPWIPTQTDAQQSAQLKWIPAQTEAQVLAQLPFIPMQQEAQIMAQLPWIPTQTEAQVRAQAEFADIQIAGQLRANIAVRPQGIQPQQGGQLVWRGYMDESQAEELAARAGFPSGLVNMFANASRQTLTGQLLIMAKWRGIISDETFKQRMTQAGYSQEDVDIFAQTSLYYPSPQDLITFVSHEVYEPDQQEQFGLMAEFEGVNDEPFMKGGMTREQLQQYWISHWIHPPYNQIAEMLQRDILIDPEDRKRVIPGSPEWTDLRQKATDLMYQWYRLVEMAPFWRNSLTEMAYIPYTRVDIRRMHDLGVVDDNDVLRAYLDQGYDIDHAQGLLLFTKVNNILPDIISRYKNGWINEQTAYTEILALGLSPERAQYVWETKIKKALQPERVQAEKDLTKAEIIKGVKLGLITEDDGVAMLMGLGYDQYEAQYLIIINVGFTSSPETPLEFWQGVQAWRKATGKPHVEIPPDLLELEKHVLALAKKLAELKGNKAAQSTIDKLEAELEREQYRLKRRKQVLGIQIAS